MKWKIRDLVIDNQVVVAPMAGVTNIAYRSILKEFGLPKLADRMDVLRETRGTLAGDTYSFEEPLRLNGNKQSTNFYINVCGIESI